MKGISIVGFAMIPAAFALGLLVDTDRPADTAVATSDASAPGENTRGENNSKRIRRLETRVGGLEADVVALRRDRQRAGEPSAPPVAAAAAQGNDAARRRRSAQHEQQIVDATVDRAVKIARFAGLDAAGEQQVADLMTAERVRYGELRDDIGKLPKAERPAALRAGIEELEAWREDQLVQRFDSDTAESLEALMENTGPAAPPRKKSDPAPKRTDERD